MSFLFTPYHYTPKCVKFQGQRQLRVSFRFLRRAKPPQSPRAEANRRTWLVGAELASALGRVPTWCKNLHDTRSQEHHPRRAAPPKSLPLPLPVHRLEQSLRSNGKLRDAHPHSIEDRIRYRRTDRHHRRLAHALRAKGTQT